MSVPSETMKIAAIALLALSPFVHAQRIAIGVPQDRATLPAGQQTVIEVDRPNTLTPSQDVSVVIGIVSCANTPCRPPSDIMGQLLYSGEFKPRPDPNNHAKPFHQNYTVTIPDTMPKGLAQIGVAHFCVMGAGPAPFLDTANVTVIIE